MGGARIRVGNILDRGVLHIRLDLCNDKLYVMTNEELFFLLFLVGRFLSVLYFTPRRQFLTLLYIVLVLGLSLVQTSVTLGRSYL